MNVLTLKTLAKIKGVRQADIAVMAGVSRQAVHRWWVAPQESLNILSGTQERLAESFGLPMQLLSMKLPVFSNEALRKKIETQLLWDKNYPNLERFVRGLVIGNLDALARLTQVFGLFAAEKIIGKQVWKKFPQYKSKIHPARRRTLEVIWNEIQNPI